MAHRTSTRTVTSGIAAAVLAIGLLGCTEGTGRESIDSEQSSQATRAIRVETHVLEPSSFADILELTGAVEAHNDATLSAQTSGTVDYLAPLGTVLKKGEIIARIDQVLSSAALGQAEAQLAAAEAQHNLAVDSYRRQEPLYRDSVISALEFENVSTQMHQAEADLNRARAFLAQVRKQFDNTNVTAPFSGRIEARFTDAGEQVSPGNPILRLVSTARVKVVVGVPERYAGDVVTGTPVKLLFPAYGMEQVDASATFVSSVIDRSSRTFSVEIEAVNSEGRLKPEMIARVLITRRQFDDAVVVPLESIIRDEDGNSVFVVTTEGDTRLAERRAVQIGATYAGRAVVAQGLSFGDRLVVAGQNLLTPGDHVEPVEQEPESPAPLPTSEDTSETALTGSGEPA
jgi:membrane fusion protein (multidrug efflux system)